MRLLNPEATHVMCAYKLPGIDFVTTQAMVDDGEFGGGRCILNLLNGDNRINRVVFVVRYYGGKHLGTLRFKCIENAANSALHQLEDWLANPPKVTEEDIEQLRSRAGELFDRNGQPWYQSENEDSSQCDEDQMTEVDSQYSEDE